MKRQMRFQIPYDRAGVALLDFLVARFPYHTREGWEERIRDGRVRVNGRRAAPADALAARDVVEHDAADAAEPPVTLDVGVVFDDRDLLVLNKPGNLPCHPGGRYFNHTLWAVVKQRFGVAQPTLVNRLDRETSGLVLVAKTPEAARGCRAQFEGRHVAKQYVALVEGLFPEQVDATGCLAEDAASPVVKKRIFRPVDRAAEQRGEGEWVETLLLRRAVHGPVSEVEARPVTGRLHQVRATLSGLGFAVVGDKLYGVDPELFLRFCRGELTDADRVRLRMDRQALHAAHLRLRHPRNGRWLELEAPLPEDMGALMRRLD
jgi:RluA family pseudouridine synthase